MKKILSALLALILLLGLSIPVSAADGNVTYSGSRRKFIFSPGSNYSVTDLFSNFKDVMPGDTLTQRIHLKNPRYNNVKVRIYMRSLGAQEGSEDFLSQLNMTVTKVQDTVLFDTTADRRSTLAGWTYLGTLYSGGEVQLDVTLTVPVTLDNTFKNMVGYLDWEFMIEELPVEDTDPKPPRTGDEIMFYVATLTASTAGLVVLLLIWKRKKKKSE